MILADLFREVVLRRPSYRAIPNLDGLWRPNEALEDCERLAPDFDAPDALATDEAGRLYVASRNRILVCSGPGLEEVAVFAAFEGTVACLAWHRQRGLAAGVSGQGLVVIAPDGHRRTLAETEGEPLRHPTGVAFAPDGSLFVTEGSQRHAYDDWVRDLMGKGGSGRLLRFAADGGEAKGGKAKVLAGGLAFPLDVAVAPKGGTLLVTEAWRHRVLAYEGATYDGATYNGAGAARTELDNLPGYPTRLLPDGQGGWWLSFFALRTQLVEFVLREEGFRRRMMESMAPDFWIAPSLSPEEHHLHPVQFGALRTQNVKKPWAPPRSYGLVVRLDGEFEPLASYHSRSNGTRHGTTGLALRDGRLLVAAKGAGCVLRPA